MPKPCPTCGGTGEVPDNPIEPHPGDVWFDPKDWS